ncbi:NAD(P)-binding domain-containing protein [Chitinophagaceae bacterium LB-8]|uniref:NAD(P)-binding domain-containing protein n=1 Tax=Paraflavisolibacter caeni TaxID=2982496 RepID=A0A9X2XU51_9BACT|nr:NAD(P)-binding domain-containing protein [Paraflavisolibacter caeni]MCU7549086.1 NAD(P)-binding domain-containing protein [Paraflavisolibacter caeni]
MVMSQANKLKVAVIGIGNIGSAVATNLVKGNRPVIVADRKLAKAETLAQKLGSLAQPSEISAAIKEADIVVLAIYFDPIKEFLKQYATELEGKIIVDPSNPIAPAENGGFKKIIDENESAGQILSTQLPKGAKLAKALGSLGVASLASAAFQQQEQAVLFYATDDTSINGEIEQLIRDSGFEPVRVGGLDQSIRLEVFGDLHEFGALGKTVTVTEANEKL